MVFPPAYVLTGLTHAMIVFSSGRRLLAKSWIQLSPQFYAVLACGLKLHVVFRLHLILHIKDQQIQLCTYQNKKGFFLPQAVGIFV